MTPRFADAASTSPPPAPATTRTTHQGHVSTSAVLIYPARPLRTKSMMDTGTHNPAATYDYWPPSAVGHNTRHVLAKPKVRRHPQHYHNQDHHLEGRGHHQHQPARGGGGDGGGRRTQRGSNKNEASATAKAAAAAVAAEVGCKKKIPAGLSPQFSALTPEKSRTYSSRNPMVSASQNTTATKSQNRSDRLYHPSAAAVEERVQSSGKAIRGSAQPRAAEEVPATCPNSGFGSSSSLGSMMGEEINAAGASAWKESCCCDCVPLAGGAVPQLAGPPMAYEESQRGGKSLGGGNIRPHHRRGRSAGTPSTRSASANISSQPYGWEHKSDVSSSTAPVSTFESSSSVGGYPGVPTNQGGVEHSAQDANLKSKSNDAGTGAEGSRKAFSAGGRRSGSWAGSSSLDREFHVILKAGVDVYKHCSTDTLGPWGDVVPRKLKGLWTKRRPMEDGRRGLVTLFLDEGRDHLCWCPPGAAELVPDERYRLNVHDIVEVIQGDESHRQCLTLRSSDRRHPLLLELDTDEIFDVLYQGFHRILERNTLRQTLAAAAACAL